MKCAGVVGLKTATPEEIKALTSKYRKWGYYVYHKTTHDDGRPLPYNGVLILKR